MRKWIGIAFVLALACFSAAQGGGGGGRQGRGGMMMMRGGGGGSGLQLALRDDVSKELNLTADQRTKLRDMSEAMRDEMRSMFQNSGGERPDPAAMQKMMQDVQAKQKKEMAAILTPDQLKRLNELRIQRAGNSAIMDPEVQTALGMTSAQKDKVQDLLTKQQEAMQAVMEKVQNQEMDRSELRPLMEKNRKIMDQELGKILTADQTKKLADMGGKPFTFDTSEDDQRRGPGGR